MVKCVILLKSFWNLIKIQNFITLISNIYTRDVYYEEKYKLNIFKNIHV